MPGKKPNKKELARMKALSDMGESYRSIARRMGKGHATLIYPRIKRPQVDMILAGRWKEICAACCAGTKFYYASYKGLMRCSSMNQAASEETRVAMHTAIGQ